VNFTMPMLLECWMTSRSVIADALWMSVMVRPWVRHCPFSVLTTSSTRARPRASSAPARNGLSVEPGSNGSLSAVLAVARLSLRWLASASTSPVFGSSTTMSPPLAPICRVAFASARSQMSWSAKLSVSTTVCPGRAATARAAGEAIGRPRASRSTVATPRVPRRMLSSASSTPSTGSPAASTRPTIRRTPSEALNTRSTTGSGCTPRVAATDATSVGR
jgi:hypothetical protein